MLANSLILPRNQADNELGLTVQPAEKPEPRRYLAKSKILLLVSDGDRAYVSFSLLLAAPEVHKTPLWKHRIVSLPSVGP